MIRAEIGLKNRLYSDNCLSNLFTHVQDVISQHLRTYYLLSENLLRLSCNVFIFLLPNTNKPTIVLNLTKMRHL